MSTIPDYRLVTGAEAQAILHKVPPPSQWLPSGYIYRDGYKAYLCFRKTDGRVVVIDVSNNAPRVLNNEPVPPSTDFWTEILTRSGALAEGVGEVVGDVVGAAGRIVGRAAGGVGAGVAKGAGVPLWLIVLAVLAVAGGFIFWKLKS